MKCKIRFFLNSKKLFNFLFRLPVKTKLEEKFEEVIEKCENYEIRWLGENLKSASSFKNFEIFDHTSNKKFKLFIF